MQIQWAKILDEDLIVSDEDKLCQSSPRHRHYRNELPLVVDVIDTDRAYKNKPSFKNFSPLFFTESKLNYDRLSGFSATGPIPDLEIITLFHKI